MPINKKLFSIALVLTLGLDVGWSSAQAVAPPCQPLGPQKGLVIAINFPSNPIESKPINEVNGDYFVDSDSLVNFWDEVSYSQTTLTGDTLGWFTLDYP